MDSRDNYPTPPDFIHGDPEVIRLTQILRRFRPVPGKRFYARMERMPWKERKPIQLPTLSRLNAFSGALLVLLLVAVWMTATTPGVLSALVRDSDVRPTPSDTAEVVNLTPNGARPIPVTESNAETKLGLSPFLAVASLGEETLSADSECGLYACAAPTPY